MNKVKSNKKGLNRHEDFEVYRKQMLKNPKVKAEYDKLQPDFEIIQALINARVKKKMTMRQLAARMKIKRSVITKLEEGTGNPTLGFLKRLAEALGTHLEIKLAV